MGQRKPFLLRIGPDLRADLESWAKQGVLLLNSALTVVENRPSSHSALWKDFTNQLILDLSETSPKGLVFVLWGSYAWDKIRFIDTDKHHILTAPHPAYPENGFYGSKPFSKCNSLLSKSGRKPIVW